MRVIHTVDSRKSLLFFFLLSTVHTSRNWDWLPKIIARLGWSLRKYQYTQTAREFDGSSTETPFVSMWLFIDRLLWMYVYFIDNTPSRIYIYIYILEEEHSYLHSNTKIYQCKVVCMQRIWIDKNRWSGKKEETNATDNYRIQPDTNDIPSMIVKHARQIRFVFALSTEHDNHTDFQMHLEFNQNREIFFRNWKTPPDQKRKANSTFELHTKSNDYSYSISASQLMFVYYTGRGRMHSINNHEKKIRK